MTEAFPLRFQRVSGSGGTAAAREASVINPTLLPAPAQTSNITNFWQHILGDNTLQNCNDLEKLLAGCEIIAALDDLDLLAA
jgi:hypothetical protein